MILLGLKMVVKHLYSRYEITLPGKTLKVNIMIILRLHQSNNYTNITYLYS